MPAYTDDDFTWYTPESREFMKDGYLKEREPLHERVAVIAHRAEELLKKKDYADKFTDYLARGWYSLSTPVWANFGTERRGLPISCFNSYCSDTMDSIAYTHAEVMMMTKHGGGTSVYCGEIRPRGSPITDNGDSNGSVHFMQLFNTLMNVASQGRTRRGNCAIYLPIYHKDILEFLRIRTDGHPIQDLFTGVCVPDWWLEEMIAGDYRKRVVWAKVLECRMNFGYPYIFFTDNVNAQKPDVYKDKNLTINCSNLCSEALLSTDDKNSFVCCLSSMNMLHFEEWRNTDAVEVMIYLLDAVMEEFILKARDIPFMERAVRFAEEQRALGLGWFGWHSLLQSRMLPFDGTETRYLNITIAKEMQRQSLQASAKLAKERGEPYLLRGYGRRNVTTQAIAPTKSSSFIIGQASESIAPYKNNYGPLELQKGKFTFKNPYLAKLLQARGKDDPEAWGDILKHGGSVQHLDWMSSHEKRVFRTAMEVPQREVVVLAAQRQKYIDQGQSLNLDIHPSVPVKEINNLILEGWKMGVKSLYYQNSQNAAQSFARSLTSEDCASCQA